MCWVCVCSVFAVSPDSFFFICVVGYMVRLLFSGNEIRIESGSGYFYVFLSSWFPSHGYAWVLMRWLCLCYVHFILLLNCAVFYSYGHIIWMVVMGLILFMFEKWGTEESYWAWMREFQPCSINSIFIIYKVVVYQEGFVLREHMKCYCG